MWGMKVSPSSSYGALAEVFVIYTSEVIFVTGILSLAVILNRYVNLKLNLTSTTSKNCISEKKS